MKVLHVILKVQPTNGQYHEHCRPLADQRDITICSFLPSTLPVPGSMRLFEGDGSFRSGWRALRRALHHQRYDVVHVHAPQTGLLLLLALVLPGRTARRSPSPTLGNAIYTVQNSYGNYRLRNRLLMVPIFFAYRRVVFCSDATRRSMTRLLRWATRRSGRVVPNCVDLAPIDEALAGTPRPHGEATSFEVVSAGRIIPIKDPLLVAEAFALAVGDGSQRSDARLTYVGDGALRPDLEGALDRLGLADRTELTGMVPRHAVHARLGQADLYVSASHGEGLPVAVLEAMACRCPVVLSDIPPHRELAEGEPAIVLVPVGDVAGFAAAIRRLAAMDPEERAAIGERCRSVVERRYSLDVMHHAYEPIYREASEAALVGSA